MCHAINSCLSKLFIESLIKYAVSNSDRAIRQLTVFNELLFNKHGGFIVRACPEISVSIEYIDYSGSSVIQTPLFLKWAKSVQIVEFFRIIAAHWVLCRATFTYLNEINIYSNKCTMMTKYCNRTVTFWCLDDWGVWITKIRISEDPLYHIR